MRRIHAAQEKICENIGKTFDKNKIKYNDSIYDVKEEDYGL
jgi:hypothetical protein